MTTIYMKNIYDNEQIMLICFLRYWRWRACVKKGVIEKIKD